MSSGCTGLEGVSTVQILTNTKEAGIDIIVATKANWQTIEPGKLKILANTSCTGDKIIKGLKQNSQSYLEVYEKHGDDAAKAIVKNGDEAIEDSIKIVEKYGDSIGKYALDELMYRISKVHTW